jgi:heme/copper-type cytochrome/quinol oxidase subunit 2
MANRPGNVSLWLSVGVAFLLPAACALNSRMHPPDLAPEEQTSADFALILMTAVTALIIAMAIYLVWRFVLQQNAKSARNWDIFPLFFFLGIAGSLLARTIPLPGF